MCLVNTVNTHFRDDDVGDAHGRGHPVMGLKSGTLCRPSSLNGQAWKVWPRPMWWWIWLIACRACRFCSTIPTVVSLVTHVSTLSNRSIHAPSSWRFWKISWVTESHAMFMFELKLGTLCQYWAEESNLATFSIFTCIGNLSTVTSLPWTAQGGAPRQRKPIFNTNVLQLIVVVLCYSLQ